MSITTDLNTLRDHICDVTAPDDMAGDEAVAVLRCLWVVRNVVDHLAATVTGVLDRRGVAASQGRTLRELLITLGCAPAVAARLVRIGAALPSLPTLAAHAADGAIPSEHVDAIVKGINHIQARAPGPIDQEARFEQVTDLLGQFFSGATPADIGARARRLGNRHAAAEGGLPAAEDRSINTVDHRVTSDGRLQVRVDLDAEVGAKYIAAIEEHSAPRPEPDGSPDTRSAARRRARRRGTTGVSRKSPRGRNGSPMAPARPSAASNVSTVFGCSTTSRRRYGEPSAPRVDSALAMFDTATSSRARM